MATATKSRRTTKAKTTTPKVDGYQTITDQMIELLEAGTAPWRKPWSEQAGLPMSMSSRKPYRGINVFVLSLTAQVKGYGSSWWGTYKQIEALGGQVRKGEKSTTVIYWSTFQVLDEATGKTKTIPSIRTFRVFNADQAEGELKLPAAPVLNQHERMAECDELVAAYYATGPARRDGGDIAAYSPSLDTVYMPSLSAFSSREEYYAALFHETVHSTGHTSRLKRDGIVEDHKFGDELYSKEELIAEMGASYLAGFTGIDAVTLPNSAAYLASWIKVLKGDKNLLVQAAGAAQKATDLILGISYEKTETAAEAA